MALCATTYCGTGETRNQVCENRENRFSMLRKVNTSKPKTVFLFAAQNHLTPQTEKPYIEARFFCSGCYWYYGTVLGNADDLFENAEENAVVF